MNVSISFEVMKQGVSQGMDMMQGVVPLAKEALESGGVIKVTVTNDGASVPKELRSIEELEAWAKSNGLD